MAGLLPLGPGSVGEVGDEAAGRGPERNYNGRPQCTDCVRMVHYLREAAKPVYEADRHAKVQLKKKVRGIRPIERKVEGREDAEAEAIRGYCAAVRSALTDDGRPPLEASGLKLLDRLAEVAASLDRVGGKKGLPKELTRLRAILAQGPGGDRGAVAGRAGRPSAGCTARRPSSATRRGWTPRGCGVATAG